LVRFLLVGLRAAWLGRRGEMPPQRTLGARRSSRGSNLARRGVVLPKDRRRSDDDVGAEPQRHLAKFRIARFSAAFLLRGISAAHPRADHGRPLHPSSAGSGVWRKTRRRGSSATATTATARPLRVGLRTPPLRNKAIRPQGPSPGSPKTSTSMAAGGAPPTLRGLSGKVHALPAYGCGVPEGEGIPDP
jgi:hypothetical protein